jgi:HlyD family secretion protein
MEPTNQPPVKKPPAAQQPSGATVIEFLPDADEIEHRPLPRLARITLYVLLATLLSFLLWAILFEVDRLVVARGRLITPLPNIVVQPLETSIIQSIEVHGGQVVKKGERLATLDPTFAAADEAQLRIRLHSLEVQKRRLEAELAGGDSGGKTGADADSQLQARLATEKQGNYQAQITKINESLARLRASQETNRRDIQALAARLKPLQEMENMLGKLMEKQYGARVQYLEAQEKRLEVEREMRLVKNKEEELKRELAAAEAEKSTFEKGWRQKVMEELLETSRERDTVDEQLQKAGRLRNLVTLTAPADAVVLDIAKLSQGSIAKAAEPLFTLVPISNELEAEVEISTLDIGYVKTGDDVHIKLDAFPFQRHGTLAATVHHISEDAFRREENQTNDSGLDAYYTGRIRFQPDTQLKKMPPWARLLPGMTLTAEIVVGKRSVISYLLWPLTKALDESIHEP